MLAAAAPAAADGWSIFGTIRQSFQADSNLQLEPGGDESVGGTTTASTTFSSANGRSALSLTPGVRASVFTGDTGQSNLVAPQFAARLAHRVGAVDFRSGLSLDIRPTTFGEIGDTDSGIPDLEGIDENATQIRLSGNLGFGLQLNARNSLNFGLDANALRFDRDADALSPSTTVGARAGLDHAIDEASGVTLGVGLRRIEIEGDNPSESVVFDVTGGLRSRLDEQLSLNASLGLNVLDTEREAGADELGLGFSFRVGATWSPTRDFRLSLAASQALEPSTEGELETRTSISLTAVGVVNEREQLSVALGVSRQDSASTFNGTGGGGDGDGDGDGGAEHLARASVGYTWAILPDLSADLRYAFRWRPDSGEEATSHNLSLTVSKSFTISR